MDDYGRGWSETSDVCRAVAARVCDPVLTCPGKFVAWAVPIATYDDETYM